jgi:exodeoxyribonuclease V alpha subunit
LLGYRSGKIEFSYNQQHQLPYDVVIVDEASMIDLALMSKLLCALHLNTHLILLGDADQLAAVETGAVFGELCQTSHNNVLHRALSRLQYSYRFAAQPGIGQLAHAVNQGNSQQALAVLEDPAYPEINWLEAQASELEQVLSEQLPLLAQATPITIEQFAQQQGQFQLLCAHREGSAGVAGLNQQVENLLRARNRVYGGYYYPGKPILITQNNHQLNLYNGDLGLVASASTAASSNNKLSVYFSTADGQLSEFSLPRLPAHETAWALTVHKSQGSEFDRVLLVLPDVMSPVLSRELIYTAITRAKNKFTIIANRQVLANAIAARTQRHSGLADKLKLSADSSA